jgi:Ras GTPase-activating-like protein IQGAP2/3
MVNQIEEEGRELPPDMPRSVTSDAAAANPDVIAIITPRLTMLMDVANRFLDTIIGSLDQVPYGIRWICKQIRSLTKRKYPEATDIAICSLIGGFFFLRFLNPAIVTPQAYMLVDRLPGKHPRTTLTLVRIERSMQINFVNSVCLESQPPTHCLTHVRVIVFLFLPDR